jgi:hypothetical protein
MMMRGITNAKKEEGKKSTTTSAGPNILEVFVLEKLGRYSYLLRSAVGASVCRSLPQNTLG